MAGTRPASTGTIPRPWPAAIDAARDEARRPSLIACRTVIGYGAPTKQGKESTHGAPLGAAGDRRCARRRCGWPHRDRSRSPTRCCAAWRRRRARGGERPCGLAAAGRRRCRPGARDELARHPGRRGCRRSWQPARRQPQAQLAEQRPTLATRKSSEAALGVLTEAMPELVWRLGRPHPLQHHGHQEHARRRGPASFDGRYLHYGVREHAMAAAMNGIALHGGFVPYGGTFLVFADYCRPAIRLAALMGLRVIHVMTHDFDRPRRGRADPSAGRASGQRCGPSRTCASSARPMRSRPPSAGSWQSARRGAVAPGPDPPEPADAAHRAQRREPGAPAAAMCWPRRSGPRALTLLATGSEVHLAIEAREQAGCERLPGGRGLDAVLRAVRASRTRPTAPRSSAAPRASPSRRPRPSAGPATSTARPMWSGMRGFGASAPAKDLFAHFGITVEAVLARARARLALPKAA